MTKTNPGAVASNPAPVAAEADPVAPPAEGANVHGIGPDTDGGPNPDFVPDADPKLPDDAQMADPAALPDTMLLQRLVEAITARNTDQHRDALWHELEQLGASIQSGRMVLAGVSAGGTGTLASLLSNWCNAARRQMMEAGHV